MVWPQTWPRSAFGARWSRKQLQIGCLFNAKLIPLRPLGRSHAWEYVWLVLVERDGRRVLQTNVGSQIRHKLLDELGDPLIAGARLWWRDWLRRRHGYIVTMSAMREPPVFTCGDWLPALQLAQPAAPPNAVVTTGAYLLEPSAISRLRGCACVALCFVGHRPRPRASMTR